MLISKVLWDTAIGFSFCAVLPISLAHSYHITLIYFGLVSTKTDFWPKHQMQKHLHLKNWIFCQIQNRAILSDLFWLKHFILAKIAGFSLNSKQEKARLPKAEFPADQHVIAWYMTRLGASLTRVDCRPVERTWVITGSTFSPFDRQREENKTIRRLMCVCEEALSPGWLRQFWS